MFKFLAYYAIPLCVIAGFYLGMARHLELSTRNMPGELSCDSHRMEQIKARKKVSNRVKFLIFHFEKNKEQFWVFEILLSIGAMFFQKIITVSAT